MLNFFFSNLKNIIQNILIKLGFFGSIKFIYICIKYYTLKLFKIPSLEIEILNLNKENIAISYNAGDIGSFLEIFNQKEYDSIFELVDIKKVKPFTFIDLGANVGYNFVYYNQKGLLKKYIGVEPYPKNIKLLLFNSYSKNTTIIPKALWIDNKGILFTDSGISNSNSINKDGKIKVETITLKELIDDIKDGDIFLKMDIEGAEFEILKHDINLISKKAKYIAIEFHDIKNREYKILVSKLKENFNIIEKIKEDKYSVVFGLNKNL